MTDLHSKKSDILKRKNAELLNRKDKVNNNSCLNLVKIMQKMVDPVEKERVSKQTYAGFDPFGYRIEYWTDCNEFHNFAKNINDDSNSEVFINYLPNQKVINKMEADIDAHGITYSLYYK